MNILVRYFILLSVFFGSAKALAAVDLVQGTCPVNLALTFEQRDAMIGLNSRLSHLNDHYGKPTFSKKLSEIILADEESQKKVIEVGPVFMEKILNVVDQHYLRDSIAATIGLDSQEWSEFERVMKKVTFSHYGTENKHGGFTKKVDALVKAIRMLSERTMKTKGLDKTHRDILKERVITRIAMMVIYLERWGIINYEIVKQLGEGAGKQFLMNMVSMSAGALLVASIMYAGPIVAGAGTVAAGLTTDIVLAANLARMGQVLAGAGMGIVGAPTGLLLADSTSTVMQAITNSRNAGTVYACELDKQINAWKSRGISPYVNASIVGGTIGLAGGVLTLTTAGARVILLATTFGVGVAELYTVKEFSDLGMQSLAEYRLAIQAQEAGDNELARKHLQQSRTYAQQGNETLLEGIVVGALTYSIGTSFRTALIQGEQAIRIVFANSADTLPTAVDIGVGMVTGNGKK